LSYDAKINLSSIEDFKFLLGNKFNLLTSIWNMQNLFNDSIEEIDRRESGLLSKAYLLIGFITGTLIGWPFLIMSSAIVIGIIEFITRREFTPSLLNFWLMACGVGNITALILWRVKQSRFSYAVSTICLVLSMLAFIFACIAVYWYTNPVKFPGNFLIKERIANPPVEDPYSPKQMHSTIFSYLAQPNFSGAKLEKQILGDATLEFIEVGTDYVYLTLPAPKDRSSTKEFDEAVAKLLIDPTNVDRGKKDDGYFYVGRYSLWPTEEKWFFFRTPASNIKLDPDKVLSFQFSQATYTLTVKELIDLFNDRTLLGGPLYADTGESQNGIPVLLPNHATMITKSDEKSIGRFAAELTKDISNTEAQAREKRVQRLLDFVSKEIEYDENEATSSVETLKRPNEVLMTGRSDCSNKAILLGSLLGHIGEDYLLVYIPKHITVAVRKGEFTDDNKLSFTWNNENWVIAESTAPGFRIGVDQLKESELFKEIKYVQRPRESNKIFNITTGKELAFKK
jgi:hypothetical protein